MSATQKTLEALCKKQPKFLKKGGLCVALVVTQSAMEKGLPLDSDFLRTREGGQVAGLGKAAVQRILENHGILRVLAEEGGRTSRGSLGLMETYVAVLNKLNESDSANLKEVLEWWIDKVRHHFASEGPIFNFDPGKSLSSNIEDLLQQAHDIQVNSGGTNYVGPMLQHLVGAKLDLILSDGQIVHRGFSVSDQSTGHPGDYRIDAVAIHVTTHPSESLIRKCAQNLKVGLKPVIVTIGDGVAGAAFLLKNSDVKDRVDVLDAAQFLTANIYERSFFQPGNCQLTLTKLIGRYNQIVAECETDPTLSIRFAESTEE